jgi:hypothetical protein
MYLAVDACDVTQFNAIESSARTAIINAGVPSSSTIYITVTCGDGNGNAANRRARRSTAATYILTVYLYNSAVNTLNAAIAAGTVNVFVQCAF